MVRDSIKKLLLFFLVFVLIFRPEFVFIPMGINKFFGLSGLIVYFLDNQTRNRLRCLTNTSFKPFMLLLIPPLICSLISLLINSTSDMYFPQYVLSMLLAFYSAYLIAWGFIRIYGEVSCQRLTKYIVVGCVVYTLIAFVCFIKPSLFIFLNSIQRFDEIAEIAIDRTEGTRLIGIGAQFFTSAIVNGISLILIGASMVVYRHNYQEKLLILTAFIVISILGIMMARTLMFGILIGGGIFAFSFIRSTRDFFQSIVVIMLFAVIAFLVLPAILKNYSSSFDVLSSFGFEMFINKAEGGRFESHSMLHLYEMWNTIPHDTKSWIIGDGLWTSNEGYYMNVDLGYLRHIWYFGIIGTFFIFRYYFLSIKYIFWDKKLFSPKYRLITLSLILFVLILNAKGGCDLFIYIIPFYFCTNDKTIIQR